MDEVSTRTASNQRRPSEHLRSASGDMVLKDWERDLGKPSLTLFDVTCHSRGEQEKSLSIRRRSERKSDVKAADGVVVLMMGMQHNVPGGKSPC